MSETGTLEHALQNGARLLRTEPAAAAAQARAILEINPSDADALRLLGAALRCLGRHGDAEKAELDAIGASAHDPAIANAAIALADGRLNAAEHLLRPHLKAKPDDVAAIKMLAEIADAVGAHADAESLLRRALTLAPGFVPARSHLAKLLFEQNRPSAALEILEDAPEGAGAEDRLQTLKASAFGRIGAHDRAIAIYEALLAESPDQAGTWMSYGHSLKTVGRRLDAVAAYRRALAAQPMLGEAWWSLANLKAVSFDAADLAALRRGLAEPGLSDHDRLHFHFTLGKALEDAGSMEESFRHYDQGNRLRRAGLPYDPEPVHRHVARSIALFDKPFLHERQGQGSARPDPIFVLGMPRSGSTLLEQILSSHSQIEGTAELPDIAMIARRLGAGTSGDPYPQSLAKLGADDLRRLGEEYLHATRVHRTSGTPFFIDKMPNNWAHVGLIALILPQARIIDARRHPLGCCLSNFKQHFARGQAFAYSQEDMGRYYRDYARLMRHFDTVLPGRVHRVLHEDMVADPEAQIRRMLRYLGLPFEEACLHFHENDRAVRTASSEQVRRPINRDGVDRWRAYEPWLGPLKRALGPVLERYPEAPGD